MGLPYPSFATQASPANGDMLDANFAYLLATSSTLTTVSADGNYGSGSGTNNSTAIQAAINALSVNGGGALYIPAGIYSLASQITVPSGITLFGAGKWSTIFTCPAAFANTGGLIRINGTGGYPTRLHGFGVITASGGSGGSGIVSVKNGFFLSDVWVNGFLSGGGVELHSTDNFLEDFAIESCLVGLHIANTNVTVQHGTLYDCTQGSTVANNASVEAGRVNITAVRANACAQFGFAVAAGKQVTYTACTAAHETAARLITAGLVIDSSSDIIVDGFSAKLLSTPSTLGHGIKILGSSSNIGINNPSISGFLDGINSVSSIGLRVSGGSCNGNGRHGIHFNGGDQCTAIGVDAIGNGSAGGSDCGIKSDNTAAFSTHKIIGCTTTQTGGGPQEYGIDAALTDNGASTGVTLIEGNVSLFNATADIRLTGATGSIRLGDGNIRGTMVDTAPVVASAAAITLPRGADTVLISGTTNITSITATGCARRTVRLIFQGALTFTDGSNLKLQGNFVTTADDSITLYGDGVSWFEVCRSPN